MVGSIDRRCQRSLTLPNDSKHNEASFRRYRRIIPVIIYESQTPRSPDLALVLSLAHARGVNILPSQKNFANAVKVAISSMQSHPSKTATALR